MSLRRGLIGSFMTAVTVAGLMLSMRTESAPTAGANALAARVALGQRLFSDKSLSGDGKVSCASCHQAALAFSDGKPVSIGFSGKKGLRNAPSLLNVGNQTHFFWDGRRDRLEDQVLDPLVNPVEHALADQSAVLARLRSNAGYKAAFRKAFPDAEGDAVQSAQLAQALASFVRTLVSRESAIDRFLVGKDTNALSADARKGFDVFSGKAQCVSCHSLTPDSVTGRILLTDQGFHAHGVAFYGMHQALDQKARLLLSEGKPLQDAVLKDPQGVDALGRFMVTGKMSDVGAFKTPSLRNVARTAPYFHDGRVATLELAVNQELLSQGSEQRPLTPEERRVLLVFMRALNDDE